MNLSVFPLVLSLWILVVIPGINGQQKVICEQAEADLVFVLDYSGSVGTVNFEKMKNFTKNFLKEADIDGGRVRVGVITYSDTSVVQFHLNEYHKKKDILNAIDAITFLSGGTNTAAALTQLRTDAFTVASGDRANVNNFAIVMTDGHSSGDPISAADAARNEGIHIFAIGIGLSNTAQLEGIANKPSEDNVFAIDNFNELENLNEQVFIAVCEAVYDEVCHQAEADLVFVLDASGSVGGDNFLKMKNFTKNFLAGADIDGGKVRVAVIVYSSSSHVRFHLNTYSSKLDIINAINALAYIGSGTLTGAALLQMNSEVFTSANGDRANVNNFAIVMTDGYSGDDPVSAANASREAGIHIFAIGIGLANTDQLEGIANKPSADNVFAIDNFAELDELDDQVFTAVCDAVKDKDVCNKPMDLLFLADKSGSIQDWQFVITKQFIAGVIENLNIGKDGVHVALGLFASDFHLKWCFDETYNKTELIQETLDMTCPECLRGNTVTGLALEKARTEMFVSECGAREGVPRVVVVLTDGKSTEHNLLGKPVTWVEDQSSALQIYTGAEIIAIGVGAQFGVRSTKELEEIASNDDNIYTTDDFNKLTDILKNVSEKTCDEADICKNKIDLVFLVDNSGSIQPWEFNETKEFIIGMLGHFAIGKDDVQVALGLFAQNFFLKWCLDHTFDKAELIQKVDDLSCPQCRRGNTVTGISLQKARTDILVSACGARHDAAKVVVVLTDGLSTEHNLLGHPWHWVADQSYALQLAGAKIIAIGVGDKLGPRAKNTLKKIAGHHDDIFHINDFSQLKTIIKNVSDCACSEGDQDTTTPVPPPAVCKKEIDLVFLIDRSGSIDDSEFHDERDFVVAVLEHMDIREISVHVALGIFASDFHHQWCFNDTFGKQEIIQKAEKLRCTRCVRGDTVAGLALEKARTEILVPACGARDNVDRVVVVLTDGKFTENTFQKKPAGWVKSQSEMLQTKAGAEVIVVGLGNFISQRSQRNFKNIASSSNNIFAWRDPSNLQSVATDVSQAICQQPLSQTLSLKPAYHPRLIDEKYLYE